MTDEPVVSANDSFILKLDATGEGTPLPLGLSGMPTKDDAGQPIHYRKMKVAQIGDWYHVGSGDPIPITKERVDEWAKNHVALSAAGRKAFVPTRHVEHNPDAKDNQGFVLSLSRDGDDVNAVVALHGDEALKIAARNGRSIYIKKHALDAKGNVYGGEWLHHLALVPNPALPDLGGMVKIAASASTQQIEVPVFELPNNSGASAPPLTPAVRRKEMKMNAELATKARATLSLSADKVPDDKLDDAVAEKCLALSADNANLIKERDEAKAATTAALAEKTTAIAERDAKANEVLSLSADSTTKDPVAISLITRAFKTDREAVIASGVVSEAGMREIDNLYFSEGKPGRAALALSAGSTDPHYSRLCEILKANPGIKTNNTVPRDVASHQAALALSAGGSALTPEEVNAGRSLADRVNEQNGTK